VDTTKNFTEASAIYQVERMPLKRAINDVVITGGFVDGSQVTSDGSHTTPADIALKGINPYRKTHSHLDTNALCNTTATNVLSRLGTQPEVVSFTHTDATIGLMQEGETITFEYAGIGCTIASDQFGIRESVYDARIGKIQYMVSDRVF
jgi:hypothetical protein